MSVFTHVTRRALEPFLSGYDVGKLMNFHGISEGVENTNYFVDTSRGRFVLTVFERLDYEQLPYFLGLMAHLNAGGVATPAPVLTSAGQVSPRVNRLSVAAFRNYASARMDVSASAIVLTGPNGAASPPTTTGTLEQSNMFVRSTSHTS